MSSSIVLKLCVNAWLEHWESDVIVWFSKHWAKTMSDGSASSWVVVRPWMQPGPVAVLSQENKKIHSSPHILSTHPWRLSKCITGMSRSNWSQWGTSSLRRCTEPRGPVSWHQGMGFPFNMMEPTTRVHRLTVCFLRSGVSVSLVRRLSSLACIKKLKKTKLRGASSSFLGTSSLCG